MGNNSTSNNGPQTKKTIEALWRLERILLDTRDFTQVVQKIVDGLLTELGYLDLGYSIIVLALVDSKAKVLKRISISQTENAKRALELSPVKFKDLVYPLNLEDNLAVHVIRTGKAMSTYDWKDILYPSVSIENARQLQKNLNIKSSMVYPIIYQGEPQGVLIFSLEKDEKEVSYDEKELLNGFTDVVGLAVQNARLFSQLEQKKNELANANNKLKELGERKDEFLNIAAHELRAPMTAIKGYLSMIMEGDAGAIPDQVKAFLGEASTSNDRLIRLVNNMLNTARIEENRQVYSMAITNLVDVTQTVFNEFKQDAVTKKLTYNFVSQAKVANVYVDTDRIHEVIGNFVSNAIKYTEHGSVQVMLKNPTPNTIRFDVIDTGPGIPAEAQPRIFEKYYRVETVNLQRAPGTGLGLYISKLLIEKFGGRIGFNSEVGRGSNFWFELPITNQAPAVEPKIMV